MIIYLLTEKRGNNYPYLKLNIKALLFCDVKYEKKFEHRKYILATHPAHTCLEKRYLFSQFKVTVPIIAVTP